MVDSAQQQKRADKRSAAYVNYSIRSSHVRIIEDGCPPRVMSLMAAIDYAKSLGMDVVQISYDKANKMAIVKIQDYGKFKYEQQKKEKAQKKAARAAAADIKEISFSIRIDDGDKKTKLGHIREFLSDGKTKVKITVRLLRREMGQTGLAKEQMKEILDSFSDIAELDSTPTFAGGLMSCTIRPKKGC